MASLDLIRVALGQPIDWGRFENLVVDLLAQDDLPSIRHVGKTGDEGVDAIVDTFYQDQTELDTVVQITSQKAQAAKLSATLAKLQKYGIRPKHLVIVFRQPVEGAIRRRMQNKARDAGLSIDIRDESYLVTQLGQPANGIFVRYFEDVRNQLDALLGGRDPLEQASSKELHAMLGSLSAYVALPRARIARKTLFEKTVLSAAIASTEPPDVEELTQSLAKLLPKREITRDRILAAISALEGEGACSFRDGRVSPSADVLAAVGAVLATDRDTYRKMVKHVTARASGNDRLDDATRGHIERNVRRALLAVAKTEPFAVPAGEEIDIIEGPSSRSILAILSRSVSETVARRCLLGLHEYIVDPDNRPTLARFMRTYAALQIRNVDPLGRRWQQVALERSVISLDTDAVLFCLVEDLPESEMLRACVNSLRKQGVEIVVPDSVLAEVVGHVERAPRTYQRFSGKLLSMPPDGVDGRVWHAVVRGYYYHARSSAARTLPWEQYYGRYYKKTRMREYIEFVLRRRIEYSVDRTSEIPEEWHADIEAITKTILEKKERKRPKAQFRDEGDMEARVQIDVRTAMALSMRRQRGPWATGRGYLVSEDSAFRAYERHPKWGNRHKVHMFTRSLPELCEFVCGDTVDNDALIRMLFNPVTSAAAHMMEGELDALAAAGVDLSEASLDQVEWDLREAFEHTVLGGSEAPESDEQEIRGMIKTAEIAKSKGYTIEPLMQKVLDRYDDVEAALAGEQALRQDAEAKVTELEQETKDALRRVVIAAMGQTKKGKARVRNALSRLGISVEDILDDDGSSGNG